MTDLTPLKTLLVNALISSVMDEEPELAKYVVDLEDDQICINTDYNSVVSFDADRLATAIHDHFLNREKVRAALVYAFSGPGGDSEMLAECRADWTVDRLIDSLAGGSR